MTEIDVFGNVVKKEKKPVITEEGVKKEVIKPVIVEEVVTEEETAEAIKEITEDFPPIEKPKRTKKSKKEVAE